MQSFSLSDLKHRGNEFGREAEKGNLALITRRGRPLFVGIPFTERLLQYGIHAALAESLYQDGTLSLGKAAKLAGVSIAEFSEHLGRMGIPVADYPAAELDDELKYFRS